MCIMSFLEVLFPPCPLSICSPISLLMSCVVSSQKIKQNTASRGWHLIPDQMLLRVPWTTCPSPLPFMGKASFSHLLLMYQNSLVFS